MEENKNIYNVCKVSYQNVYIFNMGRYKRRL